MAKSSSMMDSGLRRVLIVLVGLLWHGHLSDADTEREASIMGTYESSISNGYSASNLVDGKGLNGKMGEGFCAHTKSGRDTNNWFSLELAAPQKISRVQITPRLDCCSDRAQNIRITIGPSKSYDPNEPLCLPEIPQLTMEEGLTDYICTTPLHEGKYIKISRETSKLNLCEVKIFAIRPITDSTTGNCQT